MYFANQTVSFSIIFLVVSLTGFHCLKKDAASGSRSYASSKSTSSVIYTNQKEIHSVPLTAIRQTTANVIVAGLERAVAIDFYYNESIIFWSDMDKEVIKAVRLNSANASELTIVSVGLMSPDGIAFDWISRKLYWSDFYSHRIEVCDWLGAHRKVLFGKDLERPHALAVTPRDGLIFWIQWSESPIIERASMDGNPDSRQVLLDGTKIVWPISLAIDYNLRRIYWSDGELRTISSTDYNGRSLKTIVSGLHSPFGISLHGDWLYWTDWKLNTINRCNKTTGSKRKLLKKSSLSPMDIKIFSHQRQPRNFTFCSQNNGNCSHLCLLASEPPYYSCACPTGVLMSRDNRTCLTISQFLLLARRDDIRQISLDTKEHIDIVLPLQGIKHVNAIEYDVIESKIYWTDDETHCIRRAYLNGSNQENVITENIPQPDGITIDWISRNLYWVDSLKRSVEVSDLKGSFRKVLIDTGLSKPRGIAVAPLFGFIFWSDWGEKAKIERAALDGSGRRKIVSHLGWPNGIAVDNEHQLIYWCDAKDDKIEKADFNGNYRQVLISENVQHTYGFSLLGDYIYWTDWQHRSVERANKFSGEERMTLIDQLPDVMGLKAISTTVSLARFKSNYCLQSNGNCSHFCFNKPELTFGCGCPDVYSLDKDGKNCVLLNAYLLLAFNTNVKRVSVKMINDSRSSYLVDSLADRQMTQITAIDFDDSSDLLYWIDGVSKTIIRGHLDGSKVETVVKFGLKEPKDLAIDWLAGNLYWIDSNWIEVARLNGSSRKVLVWDATAQPSSIAVNPIDGYLYWSDWEKSKILQAHLDGSKQSQFVSEIVKASSLTIDIKEMRLYWINLAKNTIQSKDLRGQSDHQTVIASGLQRPVSLAVLDEYILWSDLETSLIEIANKVTGLNRKQLRFPGMRNEESLMDFTVFRPQEKRSWNLCSTEDIGCSHLCISRPYANNKIHADCMCPTHYMLQKDNVTCAAPKRFLLVSQDNAINRMVNTVTDPNLVVLPIIYAEYIKSIEFDLLKRLIYWIDNNTRSIARVNEDGNSLETIVQSNALNAPFDLAIDCESRQLYWSCSQQNAIFVYNLVNGTSTQFLRSNTTNVYKPRGLAFYLQRSVLFWIDESQPARVMKSESKRFKPMIVTTDIVDPIALIVDALDKRLYILSRNRRQLYVTNLNGLRHEILASPSYAINFMAILDDHVYYLDARNNLLVSNKHFKNSQFIAKVDKASDLLVVDFTSLERLASDRSKASCEDLGLEATCSHQCTINSNGFDFKCSCPDGLTLRSDNRTCHRVCQADEFQCHSDNLVCLPMIKRCDRNADCIDESDEKCCSETEFSCRSSAIPSKFICLRSQSMCNEIKDCDDGSDELVEHCQASQTQVTTTYSYFWFILVIPCLLVCFCYRRRHKEQIPPPASYIEHTEVKFSDINSVMLGERESLTGASSVCSTVRYPRETVNPPPSLVTSESIASTSRRSRNSQHFTNRSQRSSTRWLRPSHTNAPPPSLCGSEDSPPRQHSSSVSLRPPPPTPQSGRSSVSLLQGSV